MTSCAQLVDQRFPVQQISERTWLRATAANLAADFARGYEAVVTDFVTDRPGWESFAELLRTSSRAELLAYAERARPDSLAFLTLMLTGVCNADCEICFTDRKRKPRELTPDERRSVLAQAKALGAQFVYVPGEGEPTQDAGWWQFLEDCRELDLPAVVFTNALLFGDDALSQRAWGMSGEAAAARLADYPVYLYAKYWTADPTLGARLLGIPTQRYPYADYAGVPVPLGMRRLLDCLPRERLGVEVVVERRNADEVADVVAPFAEAHGLARIVEFLQHNGRTFGDPSYDPTPEQAERCGSLLSPTSCSLATCKAVVTVQGYLSPRIAVLEHQLPDDRIDVRGADLYDLLHSTDYVVNRRYDLSCLCESIPLELAQAEGLVTTRVDNVSAPALAAAAAGGARQATAARAAAPAPAAGCGGHGLSGCGGHGSAGCATCLHR